MWEGGSEYTYDPDGTAPIISIASSDSGDSQELSIQGLDIDGNLTIQLITLNGTTRVALTTSLWRVFRIFNNGNVDLSGTVFCYTGTGTVPSIGDPEVRALINPGNEQTLMCLYTIPIGKVGFLYRGEIGVQLDGNAGSLSEYALWNYKSRRFGKVFRVKKSGSCMIGGSAVYQDERIFPDPIPALTDIKLNIKTVTQTMGLWGTFDILLVDEDKLDPNFLIAIGQPTSTS